VILVVDNYDSFTFNLVQLLRSVAGDGVEVRVVPHDAHSADTVLGWHPSHVVISPGPGSPTDAGVSLAVLSRSQVPTLGVCLGHQCLGALYGAEVVRGAAPVHGRASAITHTGEGLFEGVPQRFLAARYHSLVVNPLTMSDALEATAWSDDGALMGLRARDRPWRVGVQFHPESVLTPEGPRLVRNFLAGRL
jgi:anthranilate synthase component 2